MKTGAAGSPEPSHLWEPSSALGGALGWFRGRRGAARGRPAFPYARPNWTGALELAGLRRGPMRKASGSVLGVLGPGFLM